MDSIDKSLVLTFTSPNAVTQFEKVHGQTLVDIVQEDEIYHLVRNPDYDPSDLNSHPYIRGRRICGRPRAVNRHLRCLMPAGTGTNHPGYGSCSFHEEHEFNHRPTRFSRLIRSLKAKGLALEFTELEQIPNLLTTNEELTDLTMVIQLLELALAKTINADMVDANEVVKISDALVRAKAQKAKMDVDLLLLDTRSIQLFVKMIFEVLRRNLSRAQYSKISNELMTDLSFPVNTQLQKYLLGRSVQDTDSEVV